MVTLKKYFLLAVLMFALMFISVSTQTYASGVPVGDFTVTGEESNYTYANNTLTVVNGGEITISGTTVSDHILVPSGVTADITLDGVNIQFSDGTSGWELGTCAFEVRGTANITLKGVNTLKSGAQTAGL